VGPKPGVVGMEFEIYRSTGAEKLKTILEILSDQAVIFLLEVEFRG
jgi:hypothetical protein